MSITQLTITEERALERVKKAHASLSTKKSAKGPLFVEDHGELFSQAYTLLERVVVEPHSRETREGLLSVLDQSLSQLLHARNVRPRFETRYRAEARDHPERFAMEFEFNNGLVGLAIATEALDKGNKYLATLRSYTKMKSATQDLIKYSRKIARANGNGRANDIFRDKVTNAFVATVRFREAVEDYVDGRYHMETFEEDVYDMAESSAVLPTVKLSPRAEKYLTQEHEYRDIVEGSKTNPELRGALVFAVDFDHNLVGRFDSRKNVMRVQTTKEYLESQRSAQQHEPYHPTRISLVGSEDIALVMGNLFGSTSLNEQKGDESTARLFLG